MMMESNPAQFYLDQVRALEEAIGALKRAGHELVRADRRERAHGDESFDDYRELYDRLERLLSDVQDLRSSIVPLLRMHCGVEIETVR